MNWPKDSNGSTVIMVQDQIRPTLRMWGQLRLLNAMPIICIRKKPSYTRLILSRSYISGSWRRAYKQKYAPNTVSNTTIIHISSPGHLPGRWRQKKSVTASTSRASR